jgi:hypothetical protein
VILRRAVAGMRSRTIDSTCSAPMEGTGWSPTRRLLVVSVFAALSAIISMLTVLRYSARYVNADTILQSIQSVQNVDLFFWGQNRFASAIPLLASPFADPEVNLFVVLFLNSLCFHGLLLLVSYMGTPVLAGDRSWVGTMVVFLVMTAVSNVVLLARTLFVISLEAQPYSLSLLAALGAFLLWKRREWWSLVSAGALIGLALGVNPSVVLLAALLTVVEMLRRHQWTRWLSFGLVWFVWAVIWLWLSREYAGTVGPIPAFEFSYFGFLPDQFVSASATAVASVMGAFAVGPTAAIVAISSVAVLLLGPDRRAALLPRFAIGVLFCIGYWTVITGNEWVGGNGYAFRYYYPVGLTLIVCLAAPLASALLTVRFRDGKGLRRSLVSCTAAAGCVASLVGPLTLPSDSYARRQVQDTVDFAVANKVSFVSGDYWEMWPILHPLMDAGRTAAFGTGFKSGGDPAKYLHKLDSDLVSGDTPLALCVNQQVGDCLLYLEYWTRPGWILLAGRRCPIPGGEELLGAPAPPQRSCRVLAFVQPKSTA